MNRGGTALDKYVWKLEKNDWTVFLSSYKGTRGKKTLSTRDRRMLFTLPAVPVDQKQLRDIWQGREK